MATTYSQLQTKLARVLSDPDKTTFQADTLKDMIAAAWADVSDITPMRFTEDITPIADTSSYLLLGDVFGGPVDDVSVVNVELWRGVPTKKAWQQLEPMSKHPTGLTYSQAGWYFWAGYLMLPDRYMDLIDPARDMIRVRGYCPWPPVSGDNDYLPFGAQVEEDIILVCRIEALRRLTGSRALFTQWQTRTNNTDVSMASLDSNLSVAIQEWMRKSNRHRIIREAPG
jgi:hypothetical protein